LQWTNALYDRDPRLPRGFSTWPRCDAMPRRLRQPRFWIPACGENDGGGGAKNYASALLRA